MALTDEQREHWRATVTKARQVVNNPTFPGYPIHESWYEIIAVADHLAAVEAELAAERAKVARLREIVTRCLAEVEMEWPGGELESDIRSCLRATADPLLASERQQER